MVVKIRYLQRRVDNFVFVMRACEALGAQSILYTPSHSISFIEQRINLFEQRHGHVNFNKDDTTDIRSTNLFE